MTIRTTRSEDDTMDVAREIASTLQPGDVLLLSGDLGAGKTAFVRGLADGLGIDPAEVSSPTFTLLHEYGGGRLPLFHADLYRLDRADAESLGLDDRRIETGVLAVEWPDRLSGALAGIGTSVELVITDETTRTIRIGELRAG
jgi:tRNA threonylcarbamoyladenosine biosynthesis protein TsaE